MKIKNYCGESPSGESITSELVNRSIGESKNNLSFSSNPNSPIHPFTSASGGLPIHYSIGFTLIEILIVISIVGIMLSVSLPISYSMYQRYQASLKAEEVLTLISSIRLESFLYSEERIIASNNGRLMINDKITNIPEDIFVQIDSPVKFFKIGTTSGGAIKIYAHNYTFIINIESPFGVLTLRTV